MICNRPGHARSGTRGARHPRRARERATLDAVCCSAGGALRPALAPIAARPGALGAVHNQGPAPRTLLNIRGEGRRRLPGTQPVRSTTGRSCAARLDTGLLRCASACCGAITAGTYTAILVLLGEAAEQWEGTTLSTGAPGQRRSIRGCAAHRCCTAASGRLQLLAPQPPALSDHAPGAHETSQRSWPLCCRQRRSAWALQNNLRLAAVGTAAPGLRTARPASTAALALLRCAADAVPLLPARTTPAHEHCKSPETKLWCALGKAGRLLCVITGDAAIG